MTNSETANDEPDPESVLEISFRSKWRQAHTKNLKQGNNMGPESIQEMEPDIGFKTSYSLNKRGPHRKAERKRKPDKNSYFKCINVDPSKCPELQGDY